ncbi:hypothetical protein ACWNS2_13700 [Planococcus plakortidis]
MENYSDFQKELELLKKQNKRLLLGLNVVALGLVFQALLYHT